MIVVQRDEGAFCVGQAAHAWVSGQLARRWGNGRFAAPEPFDEFCLGAEQHDVGMAEWDLAPTLDEDSGFPTSFMDMPLSLHLNLWSAAPRRVLTLSPYAALLTSMHGHALYADRQTPEPDPEEDDRVRRFVEEQEAFQRELLDRLGEDPDRARHNQRLLWSLDFLSLSLFMDWAPDSVPTPTRSGEPEVEIRVAPAGEDRLRVTPWPFGEDEVRVRCQARHLAGPASGEDELHRALAAAPWVRLERTLVPLP